jgi:hypothetical protein
MNPPTGYHIYLYADADNSEVGLWCDLCQLPSAVRFPVLALTIDGITQAGMHVVCVDCGTDAEEDDDDGGQADDLVRL